jgi:hypothetical protein
MFLTASLASTLLAAAATTAAAQPSTATSNPPPQTESWDDVSHVNGQLVPVGEKNEYLYRYRRTNISSNPIGWITGFYGVSASYGINQHVAVRGDVNYIHPVGSEMQMTEIGVGAPLYLRRTYQGPFVEPGFIARHGKSCDECESDSTVGPQVLVGWHRTWDSGFNISAAVGAGRDLAQEEPDEYGYSDDDELFFNGYFRIGYAF